MRGKLVWQIGAVIAIIAILGAGWFLLVSPKLAEASASDDARAEVESQNALLQGAVAKLAGVDVDALVDEVDGFAVGVPTTPEVTALFRQIRTLTEAAGATLASISLTDPVPFVPGGAGATGDPKADEAAMSPTTDDSGNIVPGVVPLPVLQSDLDAAVEAGLLTTSVSINLGGSPEQILAAVQALQADGPQRRLTISSVLLSTDDSGTTTGTLEGVAWILPLAPVDLSSLASNGSPTPAPTPGG